MSRAWDPSLYDGKHGFVSALALPAEAVDEIERRVRPAPWDGERWVADYRRLRMVAVKPDDARN